MFDVIPDLPDSTLVFEVIPDSRLLMLVFDVISNTIVVVFDVIPGKWHLSEISIL